MELSVRGDHVHLDIEYPAAIVGVGSDGRVEGEDGDQTVQELSEG